MRSVFTIHTFYYSYYSFIYKEIYIYIYINIMDLVFYILFMHFEQKTSNRCLVGEFPILYRE